MRAERILSRWLEPLTDFMHAKRQRALLDVVGALMKSRRLWVTALGRALPGPAKFKHRIKLWIDCSATLVCGRSAKKSIGAWPMRSSVQAGASSSLSTGRT